MPRILLQVGWLEAAVGVVPGIVEEQLEILVPQCSPRWIEIEGGYDAGGNCGRTPFFISVELEGVVAVPEFRRLELAENICVMKEAEILLVHVGKLMK